MEQLTFELARPEPPSFANFVVGRNAEAVARLMALAEGRLDETVLVLWGPGGAGRTHLLRAACAQARDRPAAYWAHPSQARDEPPGAGALVAVDDVDLADDASQARLFTLFNRLQAAKGQLVASAAVAPARLALRDDLRTRLGWGLTYEILPLSDPDKPEALARFAAQRGFRLGPEVIDYLLGHGRRDMATLVATLAALDRYSLAAKRPVTVPLVRQWAAEQSARAQGKLLP